MFDENPNRKGLTPLQVRAVRQERCGQVHSAPAGGTAAYIRAAQQPAHFVRGAGHGGQDRRGRGLRTGGRGGV